VVGLNMNSHKYIDWWYILLVNKQTMSEIVEEEYDDGKYIG